MGFFGRKPERAESYRERLIRDWTAQRVMPLIPDAPIEPVILYGPDGSVPRPGEMEIILKLNELIRRENAR